MRVLTLLLMLVTACGRIGYDQEPVYASCTEVRDMVPGAVDGEYLIAADANSPPVARHCDLTEDGGGWMLVARDMIVDEQSLSVTIVKTADDLGGLVVRVYANAHGCSDPVDNVQIVAFADRPAWTQIRAHYRFAGSNSCWWIFGSISPDDSSHIGGKPIVPNIIPFEAGVDTIRDQVRMGGAAGDAFDGMSARCDNEPTNFWHANQGSEERSAVVILRRDVVAGPAGLATATSCTDFGPGTTSPTWWEYSEISVR